MNGWSAHRGHRRSRRRRIRSAPRSSSVDPGRCRGASPTRRAGRSPARGTRRALGAFTAAVRDGPAGDRRPGQPRPDRPRDRGRRPARPGWRAATRRSRRAGWRPAPPIQPNATRIIDLRADEDALWGDLRKKWRQYVNKARTGGIVVVDAEGDRLGEFYRIYRETADRAGLPHPRRVGVPRRLGGVRAGRQCPAAVRPDRRTASRRPRSSSSAAGRGSSSRTAG